MQSLHDYLSEQDNENQITEDWFRYLDSNYEAVGYEYNGKDVYYKESTEEYFLISEDFEYEDGHFYNYSEELDQDNLNDMIFSMAKQINDLKGV